MRPTFGQEYIEGEFRQIAKCLDRDLTVFLLGGGAMALRDLKGATKDIDLVVTDGNAYGRLWAALTDLGYAELQSLDVDYRALGASSCVENEDGCRYDIFNQQIADELRLTSGMRDRSESFLRVGELNVRLVSREDILLFKLVAGRDDDIADLNQLVQSGLDYDVVEAELRAQIDWLGDDQFVTYANESLERLDQRYGVTTPLGNNVQNLTVRYYRGLAILHALDESKTLEELAHELDEDATEVLDRIKYLEDFDRVNRDGEMIRKVE